MTFKLLLITACSVLVPLASHAQEDLTPLIQAEAQKWAKALILQNHAAMLDYTQERIVTRMGGRDAALALLKKSSEDMKSKGLAVEEAIIGIPTPPQKVDGLLISALTETLRLKTPTLKATQQSHLLAISTNEGKTWAFVDLAPLDDEKLYAVFPELKGKVKLPPKKAPVVEKNP